MESTIKKIFSNEIGENVHDDFVKFGRGVFKDKYLIEAKKQKDKWSIKTSAEFANFLVRKCLEKVTGKVRVRGIIVSTFDMIKEIPFNVEKVKQFMGIKQIVIDTEVNAADIIRLMDKYPRAFYALSFSMPGCELKIKAKAPKGAKPATGGEKETRADFCSLKTSNKEIINDLFFDVPDFKEIKIRHDIEIKDIVLPEEEKDPVKLRENAIRKGIIRRKIIINGKEMKKECEFAA